MEDDDDKVEEDDEMTMTRVMIVRLKNTRSGK